MDAKKFYNKITKILNEEEYEMKKALEEIKKELEVEIITSGRVNANKMQAFKRLQKDNEFRPRFKNVLINNNDNFTITNGFFLITYKGNQLPKELEPYKDTENDGQYLNFNFEKLQNTNKKGVLSLNFEAIIKIYKYNKLNKNKNIFTLENGFTFNIQYFLDILCLLNCKGLENVTLEISENILEPMNIITENGKAILLPIKVTDEQINEQLTKQKNILKMEV